MEKICEVQKDNRGSIVVEATISLMGFLAMMVSIICLINVFIVHNRIQFAINSAANQIAAYSYLYEMSSIGEARAALQNDGAPYMANLETVKKGVSALQAIFDEGDTCSFGELHGYVSDAVDGAEVMITDPYSVAIGALYDGALKGEQKLENVALGGVSHLLTRQYIAPSDMDANKYLENHYIEGGYESLNFGKSEFVHGGNDGKVMVIIDVTYEVHIPVVGMLLPDKQTITVHQRACAKGWTCGDGNAYEGK